VDVLLQRIGRLHRHPRARPAGFTVPRAIVLTPRTRDLLPLLRGGRGRHGLGRVYEDARIIEATWRLMTAEPVWCIPQMNRHLVEQATHPERLAAIETELRAQDGAWDRVLNTGYANDLCRAQEAGRGLLDRSAPFSVFQIPEGDPWTTRLGAKDLLATLPEAVMGPFGHRVAALRVPHFLAGGATADDVAEIVATTLDGLLFRLGPTMLRYDKLGLQQDSA
jgi:CRISPR-associated endonuclease/helicase Cas3